MLRFFLMVLDKYGMDTLQLSVICFFGWKIMTNHLKHIKDSIENICKKLDVHENKLNLLSERTAKIEGKLE